MTVPLGQFVPDIHSATPAYLQLAGKLTEAIHGGLWRHDVALPSERTLADALSISRSTARKAIDVLCQRGMLNRKRGSGTYVNAVAPSLPTLQQPLSRLTHFSEELRRRNMTPGSRWLLREVGLADAEETLSLGLSPSAPVSRLKRLRLADGVVIGIESTTIPKQYLPRPIEVDDSLYAYLDAHQGAPSRALQHIRAVNATLEQSRIAGIKRGAAMLFITRVGYLDNGCAIELTHSYYRSEYYDFLAELRR
jgi:GntR family transcriptional regulator